MANPIDVENVLPKTHKQSMYQNNKCDNNQSRNALQSLENLTISDETEEFSIIRPLLNDNNDILEVGNCVCQQNNNPNNVKPVIIYDLYEREYERDILKYLKGREETQNNYAKSDYMKQQCEITWKVRSILIDWLVDVAVVEYDNKTLHLCIAYLDNFLSCISVVSSKLQLLGAATLYLSGKIEEINPLSANELSYLTYYAFTAHQIVKMEQMLLKVLKFNLQPITAYDFITLLSASYKFDMKTMYFSMYLSELTLQIGGGFMDYLPSKLAVSSLLLARLTLQISPPWLDQLEFSTGYTIKDLTELLSKLQNTLLEAPLDKNDAIYRKYKSDKYFNVALIKPQNILELLELSERTFF